MVRLVLAAVLGLSFSSALAQTGNPAVFISGVQVTGSGYEYSFLSTGSTWQSLELPASAADHLDQSTLRLTAPGLTIKIKRHKRSTDGLRLQLALDVQRVADFQNGPTIFTLQDAAGQQATFHLNVY